MLTLIKNGQPILDMAMHQLNDFEEKQVEPKFVSIYETTRHFGGREEGGWYYNWSDCIFSKYIPNCDGSDLPFVIKSLVESLLREFGTGHGNIYSVLGGVMIDIYLENVAGENQDTERPRYE
tara:strand:- start:123 stop:488 length:366 start_codon:yes stop_codon:yes gene_type:complete